MAGHKPSVLILLINGSTFQFFDRRNEGSWKGRLIIGLEPEHTKGGTRILIVSESKHALLKPTKKQGKWPQLVQCLLYVTEDQSSIIRTHVKRLGMMIYACKPITGKVEPGG